MQGGSRFKRRQKFVGLFYDFSGLHGGNGMSAIQLQLLAFEERTDGGVSEYGSVAARVGSVGAWPGTLSGCVRVAK